MRVLVTGAGGFVGRALTRRLVAEGWEVVAATRDASRIAVGTPFQIDAVGPNTDWRSALSGADAVVHLAARAHALKETAPRPLAEHRNVNTEGTRNLARQAHQAGVRRFAFMSSIGVLGNNSLRARNGHAFTEEDEPCPHDNYSISKWEAEQALWEIEGLERVIIRPPLIYGPNVPGNLRRLIGLAKKGTPFPLGAIHNKRSLVGLDNLVDFISICLKAPKAANQTFLIADEEQISTADLYVALCGHLGVKPRLLDISEGLLRRLLGALGKSKMAERLCDSLIVDASKARNMLDWRQIKSLDEGLRETAASFQ